MAYNIGPKIGIDGEAEFRRQISQINTEYKTLVAQTKAVTAEFDKNGDEQGKLRATAAQLQKQIDNQRSKVSLLENAWGKAKAKFGDSSIEAQRLEGALYDAQAEVSKLEKELANADAELAAVSEAFRGAGGDAGDFTGSAQDAADKIADFADAADNASGDANDFSDSVDDAGEASLNFSDILKAGILSDAIMSGFRKLLEGAKDFASGMIESAAQVQAENAQFEQTFSGFEAAARSSLQAVADEAGITATRMQGSYTKIYAFAKTAGADSEEALGLAQRALEAAADSAAYYDRSIEDATETLQSFLKGNYANDAALGIAATETTRNTAANEKYAKSFQELSESQKVDVLLSMVEAGNKASGALGQAARESDSWENATGELKEAQRQLQAVLGDPVMKNTIPIIQKFTDKMNAAAKSGKLDDLAEGIGNTFGWLVDHGDDVVGAVAGIASAFIAFQATKKAGEIFQIATSFFQISTAATAAGEAMAASGAVASASPWGLAATVIGGVVGIITSIATSASLAADAESELADATENFANRIEAANENYASTKAEIEGAAYAAGIYVQRLQELEAAGLNTAVAHREYEMIVEQLNGLIPDLNLAIDEQTGLINKNSDALIGDIEAWKKNATAKALQEKYTDVLEEQGAAEAALIDAQAKRNRLTEESKILTAEKSRLESEQSRIAKQLDAVEQQINRTNAEGVESTYELQKQKQELTKEYNLLGISLDENSEKIQDNINQQNGLENQIKESRETLATYEGQITDAENALKLFADECENGGDKLSDTDKAVQTMVGRLQALQDEYEATRVSTLESMNTQIGLFDEVSEKCEMSIDDMIKNLQSQQTAFDNYADNLKEAARRGVDDGLVKQLSDGSVESMQILQSILDGSDEKLDELNNIFRQKNESKENAAAIAADFATGLSDGKAAVYSEAYGMGNDIVRGVMAGVKDNEYLYGNQMQSLARTGNNAFRAYNQINSPSRRFYQNSAYVVQGAVNAVRDNMAKYGEVMHRMAELGERNFVIPTVAQTNHGGTGTGAQNISLGGITIHVNAPAGIDERKLSRYVMADAERMFRRRLAVNG
jgi:predicted  nucleic acid-binding Zn-ribbon protein|nr:MAG TPA: chromosome segregation ATPase [Caudoviricetes sp.]